MTSPLEQPIRDVVERGACSGCGLCTRLDPAVTMHLDADGYLRPRVDGESAAMAGAAEIFRGSCPGVVVRAPAHPPGATADALLGSHLGIWRAWASDPALRHAGSSGGALSALHAWLLASGRAAVVTGAAVDAASPRRTVPVTIMTREQALAAAGSRYAPVAALDNPDVLRPGAAVVGKPCEIAALRQAAPALVGEEQPLLLSFFCAGTPSQRATDALLAELGIDEEAPVDALRYRGNGWPGRFTARSGSHEVAADYDTSWGRTLGPTTQWRCKVCVDGVGELADVVSADSWETDARGYPLFAEGEGMSALIARTERGLAVVRDAEAAGVLVLAPLAPAALAAAQPLQTERRRFLLARLLGSRLAGRRPPSYPGFRLARLTLASPRLAARVLRGTYRRVRAARALHATTRDR
ncbi:Coenzyme F420 hydrogenase/dehydrogenase, beta subunit C-terminal domain [Agrococcus sp. 1P02AA]|uniref:Coenzyme F420 hydrogenase/dehydrogenase, beta subunit C-terminal domain n=1 Tax=Agrococcus sp. 1P02AA TaxID=3132259 RepID=UPI0039A541B5